MGHLLHRGTDDLRGQPQPNFLNVGVAYLLWAFCFMGFCGVQRFYVGQPMVGFFYLTTFGFCGVGQLIDLFLIPGMVDQRNTYLKGQYLALEEQAQTTALHRLLQVAKEQGGVLSAAQATLYTGFDAKQVEELLLEAQRLGYAYVFNDPETGAVRYQFDV